MSSRPQTLGVQEQFEPSELAANLLLAYLCNFSNRGCGQSRHLPINSNVLPYFPLLVALDKNKKEQYTAPPIFFYHCLYLHRRSLSLIESLLHLAEQGHYEEVMDLLSQPIAVCPEIIFLGVIRTQVHDSSGAHFMYYLTLLRCKMVSTAPLR